MKFKRLQPSLLALIIVLASANRLNRNVAAWSPDAPPGVISRYNHDHERWVYYVENNGQEYLLSVGSKDGRDW